MKPNNNIYRSLLISALILFATSSFAQDSTFGIFKISTQEATSNEKVKTFQSAYPEVMKIREINVVTPAAILIDDIKKTEVKGDKIVLHFTYKGAKKWAKFTEESIGKQIALVVDNKVYSMPKIQAEIRTGMAMIAGIKDEQEAVRLNELLKTK